MKKNVFIANVTENDDFAISLHQFLEEHKITCFQYKIDLLPGENITQETENRIKNSDHCIICFSKELYDREKTDMHREIYTAIEETYQRKPNSKFIIPVKVNQCEIEEFKINATTSMQKLWYADFSKNSEKAYQDLLTAILGTEQEESTETIEYPIQSELISLRQNNGKFLKFHGYFMGESSDYGGWNYEIYKTADTVKECEYIVYIDRTYTNVIVANRYDIIQYDSLDSIKTGLSQIIRDGSCRTDILEILGIDEAEYLK